MNASADALKRQFGSAIRRVTESCGDTIVYVDSARLREILAWLKDTPDQVYTYLVDVTAVEYREAERPLEVGALPVVQRLGADEDRVRARLADDPHLARTPDMDYRPVAIASPGLVCVAFWMSSLTTRPPGPEPATWLTSTSISRALRLAAGEAFAGRSGGREQGH